MCFPVLETGYQLADNRNSEVRKHFVHAIKCIENKRFAVALLNLNMVLSLRPRHFLAHVYRGRLYAHEGQFRLASDDYMEANRLNSFRFLHHGLHHEYFKTVNVHLGELGTAINNNFNQAFRVLREAREDLLTEKTEPTSPIPEDISRLRTEKESPLPGPDPDPNMKANLEERSRFKEMGPITLREIEETDWDEVIKQINSS